MEALWNLEDKWKLTTKDAVAFLACTSFLVTALSIATILYKKAKRKASLIHQEPCMDEDDKNRRPPSQPRWDCVKTMLMSKVRWSRVIRRLQQQENYHQVDMRPTTTTTSLLVIASARYDEGLDHVVGMGLLNSHNSTSAVWQRPILMGEKCELPRFSGLILYDERGRPLQFGHQEEEEQISHHFQEGYEASARTTLKDLM